MVYYLRLHEVGGRCNSEVTALHPVWYLPVLPAPPVYVVGATFDFMELTVLPISSHGDSDNERANINVLS